MTRHASYHSSHVVDGLLKDLYSRITCLEPESSSFLSEVQAIQDTLLVIGSKHVLSQDQKKILQLEVSCIEDYVSLLRLNKEMNQTLAPSKTSLLKLNYLKNDISFCRQNLDAIFKVLV